MVVVVVVRDDDDDDDDDDHDSVGVCVSRDVDVADTSSVECIILVWLA